jgi:hypothetical protein
MISQAQLFEQVQFPRNWEDWSIFSPIRLARLQRMVTLTLISFNVSRYGTQKTAYWYCEL